MHLDLKLVQALSDKEHSALENLTVAVYPPETCATRPHRLIQWLPHNDAFWYGPQSSSLSPMWEL